MALYAIGVIAMPRVPDFSAMYRLDDCQRPPYGRDAGPTRVCPDMPGVVVTASIWALTSG
jgi:hypothetical protein